MTKEEIIDHGPKNYVSPLYSVQQFKKGNCPLDDVSASISACMQEFSDQQSAPLLLKIYSLEEQIRQLTLENSLLHGKDGV